MDRTVRDLLYNLEKRDEADNIKIFCNLDFYQKIAILDLINDSYRFMFVSNLQDEDMKIKCLCGMESDNFKVKGIDLLQNDYDKIRVITTLESDDLKACCLSNIKSDNLKMRYLKIIDNPYGDYNWAKVISSLKTDELKLKFIDNFDEPVKAEIICGLKSDDFKVQYMKSVNFFVPSYVNLETCNIKDIICSLESDELKLKYLDKVDDYEKIGIICSFQTDELKLKYLNKVDDYGKRKIICSLKSDELKLKHLNKVGAYSKRKIMCSLNSDELKIKYIDNFDYDDKVEIICSFESNELKSKYLNKNDNYLSEYIIESMTSEDFETKCLCQMESDELKTELLYDIKNEFNKMKVISTLKSDELKMECLNDIESDELKIWCLNKIDDKKMKLEIICSLKSNALKLDCLNDIGSDELKIGCLDKIDDDGLKIKIICSLKSDELKLKCISDFKDDFGDLVYLDFDEKVSTADIICSFQTDELKLKYLNNFDDYGKRKIICSFQTDELKVEYLDKLDDYNKIEIICSLKSDELKDKYLNTISASVEDDLDWYFIIDSFQSDELKLKYLDKLSDYSKVDVISDLKSDELKDKYLNIINPENGFDIKKCSNYRAFVINSFKNDELKLKYLDEFDDEKKADIILHFSKDELKVYSLPFLSDINLKLEVVNSLKSDKNKAKLLCDFDVDLFKIKCLNSMKSDYYKMKVISTLKTDELKMEYLNNIESDELKLECLDKFDDDGLKIKIICSLKSDKLKLRYISYFKDKLGDFVVLDFNSDERFSTVDIICSFQTDELKLKYLNNFDDYGKRKIICSFQTDELKVEYLDKLDDYNKIEIICSLKSDELKLKYLDKFDNYNKVDIICSLKSDKLKAKYLNTISIENGYDALDCSDYREWIIKSFRNAELKLKYLDELSSRDKLIVIRSLKSDELKIKYLNTISPDVRFKVVKSFQTDELKLKYLDDFGYDDKVEIICSLESDEFKIMYLSRFSQEKKSEIMCSLKSDKLKIEYLYKIYNNDLKSKILLSVSNIEILGDYFQKSNDYELESNVLLNSDSKKISFMIIDLLFFNNIDDEKIINLLSKDMSITTKSYIVSKIVPCDLNDKNINKIISLMWFFDGDLFNFIKNFSKVDNFVDKSGISTDKFWQYCIADSSVYFDKILSIIEKETDNFIRVKNYFFQNLYEKSNSANVQVKNFVNLLMNYDEYKMLCNELLGKKHLDKKDKDDLLFLFNRGTVIYGLEKPQHLNECSVIKEYIKNNYRTSLQNISSMNNDELKDSICKVLFNRDLKSLEEIINTYGNVEELRKLQFNDRDDIVIVDEIEKMIVYVSIFEEIMNLNDRKNLEKLAFKISDELDLILDSSFQKTNLKEKYDNLYALESERATTKIVEGEPSYYSVIDKKRTSEYGVDVYDFSDKEYCLYGHVRSEIEPYEDLINGESNIFSNFISLSPISYRNQVYYYGGNHDIIFGYDNVPRENFVMSSPQNLTSNNAVHPGSFKASNIERAQRGILENSQAKMSSRNSETLCIREGLKPKYIILPGGREPSDKELEFAKKYNLKFAITQAKKSRVENPKKIPQKYSELSENKKQNSIDELKQLRDSLAKYSKKSKKRRIAIMTDPHALFEPTLAILEDARRNGVNEIYSLGDNIGTGSNPKEVLDLLDKYNVQSIMGNHELYVTEGVNSLKEHLKKTGAYEEAKRNSDWTREQLTSEQIKNLKLYPKSKELLIGGKKILLCHSTKDFNSGKSLYEPSKYDMVFQGHIHFKNSTGNVETLRGAGIGSKSGKYNEAYYIILEEDGDDVKIIEKTIPFDSTNLKNSINLSSMSEEEKDKIYKWTGGRR